LLESRLPAETVDYRIREVAYDLAESARAAHAYVVVVVPGKDITCRD
jgi:hypothetical protein